MGIFYALENDVKASVRKQTSETCRRLRDSACKNLVFLSASARRCEKTSINSGPAARPSNFFMSTFIFNIKQGLQLASFRLLWSLSVRAIWLNIINFHDCLIPSENFLFAFYIDNKNSESNSHVSYRPRRLLGKIIDSIFVSISTSNKNVVKQIMHLRLASGRTSAACRKVLFVNYFPI